MLPFKKCGFYGSLTLLLFLFMPSSVSAFWFQTIGGDVYSNSRLSMLGSGSVLPANTFLSRNDLNRGSSGIITYVNTSSFNEGDGSETGVEKGELWSEHLTTPVAAAHRSALSQFNYDYFERKLSGQATLSTNNVYCNQSGGSTNIIRYTKPLTIHCNSNNDTGAGNEPGPNPGQDLILLVNGDVTITDTIGVPDNAFFMIVSSGTITIDDVVSGSPIDPGVQGVFIANRIVTTDVATTTPLFAEGIFIAHQQFVFNRRAPNNNTPAETFIYKPSLLVASPSNIWDTLDGYEETEP